MRSPSAHPRLISYPRDAWGSARTFAQELRGWIQRVVQTEKPHLAILALIVLAGIAIRVALVNRPMMDDESTTILRFVSMPLGEALSTYSIPNNHLLNTLLVSLAMKVFGMAAWSIRMPSLLAGCALIPASYLFVRKFYNRDAALLAAGLVAVSAYLIDYATASRGYSMVLCAFMLMLALAGYLAERWNTAASVLMAVIGALAIYAIPIALYPAAVVYAWLGLTLLLRWKTEGNAARWRDFILSGLLMGLMSLALYAPVLANPGQMGVVDMAQPQPWRKFTNYYEFSLPIMWDLWNGDLLSPLVTVLLAGFVLGLAMHWLIARSVVPVALVAAIVVLAMVIIPRTVVPGERIWSFLLPLYLGVSAAGITALVRFAGRLSSPGVLAAAFLALPALFTLGQGVSVYADESVGYWDATPLALNADRVATYLGPDLPPHSAILTMYGAFPAINYYQVYHYGLPGPDYVDWGKILKKKEDVDRVYVLVVITDDKPEQTPTEIAEFFGLEPSAYTNFTLLTTFERVQLFAADRK